MITSQYQSLYQSRVPVVCLLTPKHSRPYASASTTSIVGSSKKKPTCLVSKKYPSIAGVQSMSHVNYADAGQEKSQLLTLDRVAAVRRHARLLSSTVRNSIERIWLDAHLTEFFTLTDLRLVEAAEEIITHGLRVPASEAAGSRHRMS